MDLHVFPIPSIWLQTASLEEGVVRRLWPYAILSLLINFFDASFYPYLLSRIKDIFGSGSLRFHDIFYSPGWSLLCLPAPHLFKKGGGQLLDELKSNEGIVQRTGGLFKPVIICVALLHHSYSQ